MHFTDPNHPLNPFYRVENTETAFQYYAKPNTTWEQMDAFLEKLWKKDRHMDWQGFGTIGEKDFTVVVVRKSCAPHRCDLVLYDGCGDEVCDSTLEENDDGDVVCENCRDEEDDE